MGIFERAQSAGSEPILSASKRRLWPELPYREWKETCETLHLWTQVVGKVRLALTPWLNHSWHVPLYVNARGLTTSPIYYEDRALEIVFDFNRHVLEIMTSEGWKSRVTLEPRAVAEFYELVMAELAKAGIHVDIDEHPNEIPDAIPFSRDRVHAAYDRKYAHRFWKVLLQADRVLKQFRTGFIGKCSPRNRRGLERRRWPAQGFSARSSASSCCLTKRFGATPILMPRFLPSCNRLTKPPLTMETGTGLLWNVRRGSRGHLRGSKVSMTGPKRKALKFK